MVVFNSAISSFEVAEKAGVMGKNKLQETTPTQPSNFHQVCHPMLFFIHCFFLSTPRFINEAYPSFRQTAAVIAENSFL